jgi:hypothetical protein
MLPIDSVNSSNPNMVLLPAFLAFAIDLATISTSSAGYWINPKP